MRLPLPSHLINTASLSLSLSLSLPPLSLPLSLPLPLPPRSISFSLSLSSPWQRTPPSPSFGAHSLKCSSKWRPCRQPGTTHAPSRQESLDPVQQSFIQERYGCLLHHAGKIWLLAVPSRQEMAACCTIQARYGCLLNLCAFPASSLLFLDCHISLWTALCIRGTSTGTASSSVLP